MKTVLFIERGASPIGQSYLRYDFLLDEYAAEGAFELCEWHPEGNSVATVVPDLPQVVVDDEPWRAIVVADLRDKGIAAKDDRHFDNPFDYPESYERGVDAALEESSRPVVRLAQMLGGLPEKAVIAWPDIEGMKEGLVGGAASQAASHDPDERPNALGVTLRGIDIDYPATDGRYDLLDRYRLGVVRPESIVLITPRTVDEDLAVEKTAEIAQAQKQAEKHKQELLVLANERALTPEERAQLEGETPLGFWQRNDYPASARFIVCDQRAEALPASEEDAKRLEREVVANAAEQPQASRRDEWFCFWLCVLSLVTGEIDSKQIRPFELHRMDVAIDEDELDAVFSRRYAEWAAVRKCIAAEQEGELARLRTSEYKMNDMPDCNAGISVVFDQVDEQALEPDPSQVELFKDKPESDLIVWLRQRSRIFEEFRKLLRAPRRGLYNAAARFRDVKSLDPEVLEYCILNQYQCEELADELRTQEFDLARDVGPQSFSFDTYKASLDEGGEHIVDEIKKRSTSKQAIIAVVVAILALIVGFVPYIMGKTGGGTANASAVLITLGCCLVLVIVALVTLMRMRDEVRGAYRSLGERIHAMLSALHDEANRLGKRASSYATFTKRYAIYDRQLRRGQPTARSCWLGEKDALLRTRMEDVCKLQPDVKEEPERYGEVVRGGWDMANDLLSHDAFYSVCDPITVERTLNGDTPLQEIVDAPYSFISNIVLVPEKTV